MGLLLQLIGIIISLVSVVFSIIAIVNGTRPTIALIFVIVGGSLVRIGRKIHNDDRKS